MAQRAQNCEELVARSSAHRRSDLGGQSRGATV